MVIEAVSVWINSTGLSGIWRVKQRSEPLDCAFRVNHVHYQPDEYGEDSDLLGYEDGDYDQNYHSDNR